MTEKQKRFVETVLDALKVPSHIIANGKSLPTALAKKRDLIAADALASDEERPALYSLREKYKSGLEVEGLTVCVAILKHAGELEPTSEQMECYTGTYNAAYVDFLKSNRAKEACKMAHDAAMHALSTLESRMSHVRRVVLEMLDPLIEG